MEYAQCVAADKVVINEIIANNSKKWQRTLVYNLKTVPGPTPVTSKGYKGQERRAT